MNEDISAVVDRVEKTNTDRTGARYVGSLRVWFKWCDRTELNPLEADSLHVENYLRDLFEEQDYASSTLGVHRSAIKAFFDAAVTLVQKGRIQPVEGLNSPTWKNPAAEVVMSNVVTNKEDQIYTKRDRELQKRDETKGLSDSEAEAVIEHAPSPTLRNKVLLRLAYQAMLRRGEVAGLKTGDIFLDDQQIIVRPEVAKNGRRRKTYFQPSLIPSLKVWLQSDREGYHDAATSDYVFLSQSGGGLSGYQVGKIFREAVRNAGIGQEVLYVDASGTERLKYIFHDLRHAGASRRWNNDLDLRSIQSALGHQSIEITMDYLDVEEKLIGEKVKACW